MILGVYVVFRCTVICMNTIVRIIKNTIQCNTCTCVTFHGIYSFPRDSFIVNISMHFWATLDMTCSGSQGDLVSPVRGARDAPPMKSVSYQAVCAVISMSSDVKA